MSSKDSEGPTAKRLRVGERTMLACINCKQRKLKVITANLASTSFTLADLILTSDNHSATRKLQSVRIAIRLSEVLHPVVLHHFSSSILI